MDTRDERKREGVLSSPMAEKSVEFDKTRKFPYNSVNISCREHKEKMFLCGDSERSR